MYQEVFYLVNNENNTILDRVTSNSKDNAEKYFIRKGWNNGEVISEADYINELELNAHEMQTAEC